MSTRRYSLLLLLFSAPSLASDALPSAAGSALQMLLGLGTTLALLIGGLFLLKRLQSSRPGIAGHLRVLGATSVGTREKVVLLAVGKQILVLGVTPGRITPLHTLDESDLPAPPPAPSQATNSGFAQHLKQILERRHEN